MPLSRVGSGRRRENKAKHPNEPHAIFIWHDTLIDLRWNFGTALLMYLLRAYLNRYMESAVPLHLDPLSYQVQFTNALNTRRWFYQDIVSSTLQDIEKSWAGNLGIAERFIMQGLKDPRSSWVYDIHVVFHRNGSLQLFFWSAKSGSQAPSGVVLS